MSILQTRKPRLGEGRLLLAKVPRQQRMGQGADGSRRAPPPHSTRDSTQAGFVTGWLPQPSEASWSGRGQGDLGRHRAQPSCPPNRRLRGPLLPVCFVTCGFSPSLFLSFSGVRRKRKQVLTLLQFVEQYR